MSEDCYISIKADLTLHSSVYSIKRKMILHDCVSVADDQNWSNFIFNEEVFVFFQPNNNKTLSYGSFRDGIMWSFIIDTVVLSK